MEQSGAGAQNESFRDGDVRISKNNDPLTTTDRANADAAVKETFDSKTLLGALGDDPSIIDVDFRLNNESRFQYLRLKSGRNIITFDPNDSAVVRSTAGTFRKASLTRIIIHEFGHHTPSGSLAGQRAAIRFENSWAREVGDFRRGQ